MCVSGTVRGSGVVGKEGADMKGTAAGGAAMQVATKDWRNAVRVAERVAGAGDGGTSPSVPAQRNSRRAVWPRPLLCVLLWCVVVP